MCFVSKMAPTTFCESIIADLEHGNDKDQIIKSALKFMCNGIAMIDLHLKSYPTAHSMTDIDCQLALVPERLHKFLHRLSKQKKE